MEVKKILIPNKPHLDPVAAIFLLMKYGKEKFTGIEDANIIFWENSENPTEEEIKNFEKEGVLLIDVGGGIFDHHNKNTHETTTSLVASYLGIEQNPELSSLLTYIREDDLEGLHNRYGELAYLLKVMYKQNTSLSEVVGTALHILELFQAGQMDWHYKVKGEYEAKKQILKVKRNQKKLKVGIIESDNVQVANYGITQDNVSVIIQKRSSGHVMILTNKHHRIDLREVIGAIRKKELELMGYDKTIDARKLRFEGKNSQLPNWFYHRSLNSFLNGSDALVKAEPTKVPFNDIVRFVIYSLTTDKSELCDCHQSGQNCPYVEYGFIKCQERKRNQN
ncbi:MAG: hypothetical protein UT48_C0003G0018 [Parcubacteria group bacterium GW2011_GWE2_39_37]|uniref:Uncharacterized protein n=1 Tax=Candidatus Falkowbacteria bacterium GW2011_GWF2_39_8 TaxID=1618642 RepID=A0A0G0Q2I1_9BACT|nr:MAG: hypothetical protein UT48_C0003G0018 [Parcubacteria group bacterium GW2011_GWE2_39_37]KKR31581.1 MAG: hypothetical protein UT64_C0056G0006 [Candidatus Falkowbacteria bacterium GW2011_GWF2_39_8]